MDPTGLIKMGTGRYTRSTKTLQRSMQGAPKDAWGGNASSVAALHKSGNLQSTAKNTHKNVQAPCTLPLNNLLNPQRQINTHKRVKTAGM